MFEHERALNEFMVDYLERLVHDLDETDLDFQPFDEFNLATHVGQLSAWRRAMHGSHLRRSVFNFRAFNSPDRERQQTAAKITACPKRPCSGTSVEPSRIVVSSNEKSNQDVHRSNK